LTGLNTTDSERPITFADFSLTTPKGDKK